MGIAQTTTPRLLLNMTAEVNLDMVVSSKQLALLAESLGLALLDLRKSRPITLLAPCSLDANHISTYSSAASLSRR
jgi:hypothetical protein